MADCTVESFLKNSYPRVIIQANLLEYIREIVDQCKDEVSWIMEVTDLGNYDYEIESVFIPRQRVNGATTEFNADDIMHLMTNETTFDPDKWRGWGHSHVNMGVTPSGQDKKQMEEFANDCDFFIGMIHNKKGDMFCWMVDSKRGLFFKNVEVAIVSEYENEISELLKERVSKLVNTPKETVKYSPTPSSTASTTAKNFIPFKMRGYTLCFCTKLVNQQIQYGYDVEGVFYPTTLYPTADSAINAYERLITDMMSSKNDGSFKKFMEDSQAETPPLHEMEINYELEDYNRSIAETPVTF